MPRMDSSVLQRLRKSGNRCSSHMVILVRIFGSTLIVRGHCTSGGIVCVERRLRGLGNGVHGGARVGRPKPRMRGFPWAVKR